jgi:hypothetical protein
MCRARRKPWSQRSHSRSSWSLHVAQSVSSSGAVTEQPLPMQRVLKLDSSRETSPQTLRLRAIESRSHYRSLEHAWMQSLRLTDREGAGWTREDELP